MPANPRGKRPHSPAAIAVAAELNALRRMAEAYCTYVDKNLGFEGHSVDELGRRIYLFGLKDDPYVYIAQAVPHDGGVRLQVSPVQTIAAVTLNALLDGRAGHDPDESEDDAP